MRAGERGPDMRAGGRITQRLVILIDLKDLAIF